MAGFDSFYIADNESSDNTTVLLEALEQLNHIKLIYQPTLEKYTQIVAYRRITQQAINRNETLMFIDADEFVTHESMEDGAEAEHLKNIFRDPNIGMVGINWRNFGSSGFDDYSETPVTERFTYCCNDNDCSSNGHLKSATRIALARHIDPHKSDLWPPYLSVDVRGKVLDDFISYASGHPVKTDNGSITRKVVSGPLRVNHYVIKSKAEFLHKKNKRGDAMQGASTVRDISFFHSHDFKDTQFSFPESKIQRLKKRIRELEIEIKYATNLNRTLKGAIDRCDKQEIVGWLVDEEGSSKNLRVNIFINGVHQDSLATNFHRPDLKVKNMSTDGMSGFRWLPPKPLNTGDLVEIKAYANEFKFPERARTIIK